MSIPTPPAPSGPQSPIAGLVDLIPGGQQLLDILGLIESLIPQLGLTVAGALEAHPFDHVIAAANYVGKVAQVISADHSNLWGSLMDISVGQFFRQYLDLGLGVKQDQFGADANTALDVADRMVGFAFILQVAVAGLAGLGKALLSERWADSFGETVSEIPSEIGLSWALGMTIEKAFDAALGKSLEEAILIQKHTSTPEWPIVRTMLKQHVLSQADLDERLTAAGFDDHWRTAISKLADNVLPVGDLQNAYLHGLIPESEVRTRLEKLGFSTTAAAGESISDVDLLAQLYVTKAETEASRLYVSTARSLFRSYLITEGAYRDIMTTANYPALEIDDDIAAITLEHNTGRLQTSAAAIRAERLRGTMDTPTAVRELVLLGYDNTHANELVQSWLLPATKRQHGLTQAKILSYFVSGIITQPDAYNRLVAGGLNPDDATFLLEHPAASNGVRQIHLTTSVVTQLYLDQIIGADQLLAMYQQAGATLEVAQHLRDIAQYRFSRQRYQGPGTIQLTAGEVREAYKIGLFDEPTAQAHLQALGYSSDNALLLLEITAKGPIGPTPPPVFATLDAAIAFLTSLGFTITGPPDPRIAAAEQLLAQNGYTFTPPLPPGLGPITGG